MSTAAHKSHGGDDKAKLKASPRAPNSPASSPGAWVTFFNERVPILVYALLACGPVFSALRLCERDFDWATFLWTAPAQLLFLITIRFMDDVKDFDKDCQVHPDRPLPRGLLKVSEVENAVRFFLAALFAFGGVLAFQFGLRQGATFTFQVIYLYLMYIEFGAGEWLEERPFLYAITHQVAIYPGAVHLLGMIKPEILAEPRGWFLGSLALSGFFTFEVCRKLDPFVDPKKGTYLIVYGPLRTFLITAGAVAIGYVSAPRLGVASFLHPVQIAQITSLGVLLLLPKDLQKKLYKLVEALSIFYLLFHLWSLPIVHWWAGK